jgi:hypothetical protein
MGAVLMTSRRSKHDQDARTISTPAKKRSRRKLAMPFIIELPDKVDVVVVKKRGVFHLKCSVAGKAILTLISDEDGLASLTRMLWLAANEANDNQPVKSPAPAAELLELIKSCEETILELIKSKGYSNRYSAQRRVADELKDQRVAYSVMKRIRAMNFKRGARAKAIKEVAEIEDIDIRLVEKILKRHKKRDPGLQAKEISPAEWERYLEDPNFGSR